MVVVVGHREGTVFKHMGCQREDILLKTWIVERDAQSTGDDISCKQFVQEAYDGEDKPSVDVEDRAYSSDATLVITTGAPYLIHVSDSLLR